MHQKEKIKQYEQQMIENGKNEIERLKEDFMRQRENIQQSDLQAKAAEESELSLSLIHI